MKALTLASLVIFFFTSARAGSLGLRARVEASLRVEGASNCAYKCGLVWNQRSQEWKTLDVGAPLNEYIACLEGCGRCQGGSNEKCQTMCKSTEWLTYTYYFDRVTKNFGKVENSDLIEPLTSCLSDCNSKHFPTPDQGAGKDGKLSRTYTRCTNACYTSKLAEAQRLSDEKCRNGAAAGGYSADDCVIGVHKGLIEPDKACIMGCVQNLCQVGPNCNGKGFWKEGGSANSTGCQLITPQLRRNTAAGAASDSYTIAKTYLSKSQDDIGPCCAAAFQRCSYAESQMFSKEYGVSLGRVIAMSKNQCNKGAGGGTFGNVIQNYGEFQCNCKEFFKNCAGTMDIPNGWKCNFGAGKSCQSSDDCP